MRKKELRKQYYVYLDGNKMMYDDFSSAKEGPVCEYFYTDTLDNLKKYIDGEIDAKEFIERVFSAAIDSEYIYRDGNFNDN